MKISRILWPSLLSGVAVKPSVNRGVKIKIIHNLDRENNKTIMAINRWVPLYVSGMIEPYRFRLKRDVRFYHTLFLHAGKACIHGFFPSNSNDRWYEYITDSKRLEILQNEFDSILSATVPIMKVYSSKKNDDLTADACDLRRFGARLRGNGRRSAPTFPKAPCGSG